MAEKLASIKLNENSNIFVLFKIMKYYSEGG